ncbi:MAG: hypothetical protein K2W96_07455 [Gemmataceae bacterium]|nr:hypothetical protein [Gemmataceae bacterium]
MTDLQDLLLDMMVGAKAGKLWKDGPFHAAALLVPGKPIVFKNSANHDDKAKNAVASRLGYPRMLLEAAHGGLYLLPKEDDRRAVAMGVLLAVPPGKKQKPRAKESYRLAALAVTRAAHASACPATCPVLAVLDKAMDEEEAKRAALIGTLARKRCPTDKRDLGLAMGLSVNKCNNFRQRQQG